MPRRLGLEHARVVDGLEMKRILLQGFSQQPCCFCITPYVQQRHSTIVERVGVENFWIAGFEISVLAKQVFVGSEQQIDDGIE